MGKFHKILQKYWGYDAFRPLQLDIIESISSGKDTLALMPTGGGKSLTFQVPTLALNGVCLVVTPLIALMKDQVENLKNKGIPALAIFSGLTNKEILNNLDKCIYGDIKFLYVSPERLSARSFLIKLQQINVCFIAVDEAHCISQWGYDFRPSYLKISEVRQILPNVPILALTATATPEVVDDIQDRLGFPLKNVFRKSFERKNLTYVVRETDDKLGQLLNILNKIKGTAIVYVRSRKKTKEISEYLNNNNISATYYNAGLSYLERNRKQERWMNNTNRVVVATNAFGMGIDKPDVRVVVHLDLPDNIEAYFQEAGRAGRDEKRSYAVLLYNKSDDAKLNKRVLDTYPDKKFIKQVYISLCNYYQLQEGDGQYRSFVFNLFDFSKRFKFNAMQAHSSLKILQRSGYIELTNEVYNPTRLMFIVDRDNLYSYQERNANQEEIIKTILRTYSGLFVDYTAIDEELIADITNVDKENLIEYLKTLSKQKIISVIPKNKTPYISYLEPRLPESYIKISNDAYKSRKDKFIDKIESIKLYASSTHKCRSVILLEYFGQKEIKDCGQCDVCIEKKKRRTSDAESKETKKEIKDDLKNYPQTPQTLIDKVNIDKENLIEIIGDLLDEDEVKYNTSSQLYTKGK